MPQYYVEGAFANRQGVKKKRMTGTYPVSSVEPYARTIWANNPQEAIQIATIELDGGEWVKRPRVSQTTEEQRMRNHGEPEFPGLTPHSKKQPKQKVKPKPGKPSACKH